MPKQPDLKSNDDLLVLRQAAIMAKHKQLLDYCLKYINQQLKNPQTIDNAYIYVDLDQTKDDFHLFVNRHPEAGKLLKRALAERYELREKDITFLHRGKLLSVPMPATQQPKLSEKEAKLAARQEYDELLAKLRENAANYHDFTLECSTNLSKYLVKYVLGLYTPPLRKQLQAEAKALKLSLRVSRYPVRRRHGRGYEKGLRLEFTIR